VDYITKPISPSIVKARVNTHLCLKEMRDDLGRMVEQRTMELELTQDATILAMASLAETRDNETGNHIRRTQHYVLALAEHLQDKPTYLGYFDKETIRLLHKSAPLHDIGKVGIPDHILLKPGRLTTEEFTIMKTHTSLGRDSIQGAVKFLGDNSFLRFASDISISHHEKWDGSGYPFHLKGEEIPFAGRLMAVADIYDALISKRVYKPPFPHSKAVKIITEGDGRTLPDHFDPMILQAFSEIKEQFRDIALQYVDHDEERQALAC
jgi:putative two-component system response regulator